MPLLYRVDVWPPTGWPDQPWLDDPDTDAFAKSARRVCEAYTHHLRAASIANRVGSIRMFCRYDPTRTDILVEALTDPVHEGAEGARIALPAGIAALSPDVRAALVLEVVHGAVLRLGEVRGWDLAAIEVRRRDDGSPVAVSLPALAFCTSEGFVRSARTLRWRSSRLVDEVVPYAGLFGDYRRHPLPSRNVPPSRSSATASTPPTPAPTPTPTPTPTPRSWSWAAAR